ncbi:hypothetical protein E2C01_042532 [Portunus trituberculatus]|uniref:Uncharacterized protein n=1 Tax=Portunus trituberculatus TaxID=210409 RepID=A0A5B7FTW7_PORTR|nr:hypothetical protein [Portunus trituberculatus]
MKGEGSEKDDDTLIITKSTPHGGLAYHRRGVRQGRAAATLKQVTRGGGGGGAGAGRGSRDESHIFCRRNEVMVRRICGEETIPSDPKHHASAVFLLLMAAAVVVVVVLRSYSIRGEATKDFPGTGVL